MLNLKAEFELKPSAEYKKMAREARKIEENIRNLVEHHIANWNEDKRNKILDSLKNVKIWFYSQDAPSVFRNLSAPGSF